jgi:fatty acid desaturase
MMNEKSTGGIGFVGWLTLLFIALKLTGFIEWSWFWVLSPLWITFIVLFILIVLVQVLKKDY